MKNEIVLSNEKYWAWIEYIIKKNGGSKLVSRHTCNVALIGIY